MPQSEDVQPGWAVVMTKVAAEHVAERAIREGGYRVYLPMYRRFLRGVRIGRDGRRVRTRRDGELVFRPLFPGYLFVELHPDQQWYAIRSMTAVVDLIRDGSRPSLLPAAVVEEIRLREDHGAFDHGRANRRKKLRVDFKRGDTVRIIEGPFADFLAEVEKSDEKGRLELLVSLFGRVTAVRSDAETVEAVARA